jgi:hypothetical protein
VLSTLGEFSADEIAQLLQSGAAFDAAHTAASRATQGAPA